MDGSINDLSKYRMGRAEEMIEAAKTNYEIGQYKTSLNRSYYAVFHAIRAVNILDGFDSSKHSGVIAHFNQEYLKPGKLNKNLSAIIKSTYYLREKSDYDDFFIASKADVETQLKNAEYFVDEVKKYLTTILAKEL
jgi:uncharacterized protein (UPF0332 family)